MRLVTQASAGQWRLWIAVIVALLLCFPSCSALFSPLKPYLHLKTLRTNLVTFFVFSGMALSCISKICDSEALAKRKLTQAIFFSFSAHAISTVIQSVGFGQCRLSQESHPIRLRKTPRSLTVYILKHNIHRSKPFDLKTLKQLLVIHNYPCCYSAITFL